MKPYPESMEKRPPRRLDDAANSAILRRQEQLRVAKQRQRSRQRAEGVRKLELFLPEGDAEKLRLALTLPHFREAMQTLTSEFVVDFQAWPALKQLAWNRRGRWIPAEEALAMYERNWRFVDVAALEPSERALIERLKARFGGA